MAGLVLVIAALGIQSVYSIPNLIATDKPIIDSSSRIIGGENAAIETYPYQVSVQKNGKHNCGGSIISSRYILTAAHCFPKKSADVYTVRAGSTYHDQGGTIHRIGKVILSEDTKFAGKSAGDIAIVQLVEPLRFDDTRQPIGLFGIKEQVKDEQTAVVTGWGRTISNSEQFSRQLKTVNLPIVNQKICNKAYNGKLTVGEICAGYYAKGGKDACQGDSGGPMVINGRLAGIASWGYGCALPKFPGVYAEIAYHRDWIKRYAQV